MSNKYTSVYDWLKYIKANVVGINLRELRLMEMYRNHYIIILSSKHYKEIYYKCLDLGFEKSHIKYNPYDLYNNCKLDI